MSAPAGPESGGQQSTDPQFSVTQQEVDLEIDFKSRTLTGKTSITIEPLTKHLRTVPIGCRSLQIKGISIDSHPVKIPKHRDPYSGFRIRDGYSVRQYHQIRSNIDDAVRSRDGPEEDLVVEIPKQVHIKELTVSQAQGAHFDGPTEAALANNLADGEAMFEPITVTIQYEITQSRDSLQWIGLHENDARYPHVYTCASSLPGSLPCFAFPHMGTPNSKYSWRLSITCARTLGDLMWTPEPERNGEVQSNLVNGHTESAMDIDEAKDESAELSNEEKNRDVIVIGSGVVEDSDAPCKYSAHKRRWIFQCSVAVAPVNIGFAIGPFEEVDFSEFRESGKEDQLKDHAVGVKGYCLPGRADELRNTCLPLQMAIDSFMQSYISYPFAPECQTYKMCFVDDLARDVLDTATLSLCSSRLLYPESIIDNVWENSRILIRAAASQWLGVFITPKQNVDYWIIVGGSYFMAENFMAHLWGRNELRYRMKLASDAVREKDKGMPCISDAGQAVSLDPAELEWLELKAPLVLFLLHQRLIKQSGAVGVVRILTRMFSDARSGRLNDNAIWTERFTYTTEKVAHSKLTTFFEQWVFGAGVPSFLVSQAFQKKKFSVAITIKQTQKLEVGFQGQDIHPNNFFREVKEAEHDIYAPTLQDAFTGPMTIRVHEPSGMPYEQIVEIRDGETKVEFHYNSKNKNQLRKRRARQREAAAQGQTHVAEDGDDFVPTYQLGDILMTEADMAAWKLKKLDSHQEGLLESASYEWIRIDKDFEWIANTTFHPGAIPGEVELMYIMQLQGDNDVVAHLEAVERLSMLPPSELLSSVFLRTLMDDRYFYGVRVKAAQALVTCAISPLGHIGYFHLEKAFQTLFCSPNRVEQTSKGTRVVKGMALPNDFTDLRLYRIRCAIVQSMCAIQTNDTQVQRSIKEFYLDTLKFNDNSSNQFSDSFYVAYLISGLTRTLACSHDQFGFEMMTDAAEENREFQLKRSALAEIDRMRRIDEWIPSYRNVHTRAALRGFVDLMRLKILPRRMTAFLPYTCPGNHDEVRLEAFEHLIKLGMMARDSFMRYIFSTLASERSAYFRDRLWQRIHRGLAAIALGETKIEQLEEPAPKTEGLIIDEGQVPEKRNEVIDTTTAEGGLKSLKHLLKENKALQGALLDALKSPIIGIKDFVELVDLCSYLYDPVDSLPVRLHYPRYWKVQRLGEAKLAFFKIPKYRTKILPRVDLKRKKHADDVGPSPQPPKRPKMSLSISFTGLGKKDKIASPALSSKNHLPSPDTILPVVKPAREQPAIKLEKPPPVPALVHKRGPSAVQKKVPNSPAASLKKAESPASATQTPPRSVPAKRKQKILRLKFLHKRKELAKILGGGQSNGVTNGLHEGKSSKSNSTKASKVSSSSKPAAQTNGTSSLKKEASIPPPLSNVPSASPSADTSASLSQPKKSGFLKLKLKLGGGGQK